MSAIDWGTVLQGRFRIEEALRAGGMGEVYRAIDQTTGEAVAVKRVLPNVDHVELFQRRFQEEVEVLRRLECPGIPHFIDSFEHQGGRMLVMEFIEGRNLEKLLEDFQSPPPPELVVDFTIQVCRILEYLHGQNPPLIHRDVKPANIIFRERDRQAFLVDFGLAREISTDSTKTMAGTMGYAPLEQYQGKPEPRTDQYSLGATMHHLLTGQRPTPLDIIPLDEVRPDLHPDLLRYVKRTLCQRPEERFRSIRDLRELLEDLLPRLRSSSKELVVARKAQEPAREDKMAKLIKAWGGGRLTDDTTAPALAPATAPSMSAPLAPPPLPIPEPDSGLLRQVRRAWDRHHHTSLWRRPAFLLLFFALLVGGAGVAYRWQHHRQEALVAPLFQEGSARFLEAAGLFEADGLGLGGEAHWMAPHCGVIFEGRPLASLDFRFRGLTGSPRVLVFGGTSGVLIQREAPNKPFRAQLVAVKGKTLADLEFKPTAAPRMTLADGGQRLRLTWANGACTLSSSGRPSIKMTAPAPDGPWGVALMNPDSAHRAVVDSLSFR